MALLASGAVGRVGELAAGYIKHYTLNIKRETIKTLYEEASDYGSGGIDDSRMHCNKEG
jgi:hypothetical protein